MSCTDPVSTPLLQLLPGMKLEVVLVERQVALYWSPWARCARSNILWGKRLKQICETRSNVGVFTRIYRFLGGNVTNFHALTANHSRLGLVS